MTSRPIYFHGQPGALDEIALAGIAPSQIHPPTYATPSSHLIGFSLGAHAALTHAALHGASRIDLIAPAAPLQLGDFLPDMAGAAVFRAAQRGRLSRLTKLQAMITRIAPSMMLRLMFSSAPDADLDVLKQPNATQTLIRILRHSFTTNRTSYLEALEAYVMDWRDVLPKVTAPVTIWHGTADTWAPFAMSEALSKALPSASLNRLENLGHYSALTTTLPHLLQENDLKHD